MALRAAASLSWDFLLRSQTGDSGRKNAATVNKPENGHWVSKQSRYASFVSISTTARLTPAPMLVESSAKHRLCHLDQFAQLPEASQRTLFALH